MKYFILLNNEENRMPAVVNWYGKINLRNINRESYTKLPQFTLLDMKVGSHSSYSDLITQPFLLVSKGARAVIHLYDNTIPYKTTVLFDLEKGESAVYYLPILEKVDCISVKSEFNMDKSVIKKLIMDEYKIVDRPFFILDGVSTNYYVIRMDLAESLLERNAIGIGLNNIELSN